MTSDVMRREMFLLGPKRQLRVFQSGVLAWAQRSAGSNHT